MNQRVASKEDTWKKNGNNNMKKQIKHHNRVGLNSREENTTIRFPVKLTKKNDHDCKCNKTFQAVVYVYFSNRKGTFGWKRAQQSMREKSQKLSKTYGESRTPTKRFQCRHCSKRLRVVENATRQSYGKMSETRWAYPFEKYVNHQCLWLPR